MCELFAMSSDQPVRLRYELSEFATHGGDRYKNRDGWGIVFTQALDAYLFKEPVAGATSPLEHMVASHARPSRLVMAHVRRASTGGVALWNTHPFRRTIGGLVRHFAHNGDLPGLKEQYAGDPAADDCIGETDSELAFMVLLNRLAQLPNNSPRASRFDAFASFCAEMREYGNCNFLYSEGETLFVHAHKRHYELPSGGLGPSRAPGLHIRTLLHTDAGWRVRGASIEHLDRSRQLLIASVPLDEGEWIGLEEGTVMMIEAGSELMRN